MGRDDGGRIQFRLLGAVEMTVGDRTVEIASLKQRAALASLLLRLNCPVPVDTLIEDLWGESPPARVATTLQSVVSRLRRSFEAAGRAAVADGPRITARDGGYVLQAAPDLVDAVRFDRLVTEARRELAAAAPQAAAERLEAALQLWRGAAFGDLADRPFARLEAQRLEAARLAAVEDLAEAQLALGQPEEALAGLAAHVGRHPLRERAWGQMMVALYRLGRQADALRAYQEVRRILGEELGVEPTPELRRLEKQILHQDADLTGPATVAGRHRAVDIVAFLFTDIEASTRRWEGGQESMATDLARHDGLVLDAVEAGGGEVFSHTGDGFCIVFPTVPAALHTAVAVQRALLATTWSTPTPLRVRMAVHAGAAEQRAGSWFGPTLNRAARLLATAAGGQVICSQVAAELAQDGLPDGVALVDLGEHRLADLARPERVHQVTHPDLPADFPPLQSLDTRRHNLPLAMTSFVGRARELGEVLSLLETSRLLSLTGAGGAGKTRLALQVAAGALGRFPDGAWFVELASVRDPDLVATEVITSLGFLPRGLTQAAESLERLCEHLRGRRLLLVLDNCEHVVESAARLVGAVLARCADVTMLTTSREILGVPGEVVWKVPPLAVPPADLEDPEALARCDAVALFCERARAAQIGFGLSAANAAAVARICRRLDGIPLGLELAAAKIRVLGAHQVAERLDDRFRLLAGGSRLAVPRHQTLRAAMDWSYELLPAPEQAVLRRLAVFPGSFTLEAVEAIAGAPPPDTTAGGGFDLLDLLTRLVDKSLVSVSSEEPEVRYGLLETVRDYAGQKLAEAGELEATRTRHRDFFLRLADEWAERSGYHNWGPWLARVRADQDNFDAALEWSSEQDDHEELLRLAAAIWSYWYWSESPGWRRWLPEALRRSPKPSEARVEALIGLANLRRESAEPAERWEPLLHEAMGAAELLDSDRLIAEVSLYWAELLVARGDVSTAEAMVERSLTLWTDAGFDFGQGWSHYSLGWAAILDDDVERAATRFRMAFGIAERVDDDSMRASVRPALAFVAALQGHHEAARRLADEGIAIAEGLVGAPRVLIMALARGSQVAVLGNDPSASRIVARLLGLLRDLGVRYWVDAALEAAALTLADRLPEEAAVAFEAARSLREAVGGVGSDAGGLGERLRRCQLQLVETLGADQWAEAQRRARSMTAETSIAAALAALESLRPEAPQ